MATFDHGYALLIGVGIHHHPAYSLPVTANDAHALQRILSDPRWCAYPAAHIRLLCNEAATTDAVLDGFAWLTACAHRDPQATIVVYYSGHGGRNEETDTYCLLPHDATTATSRLSTATLSAALDAIHAKRLLVVLDCCHAGGMTKDGPDQDSQWTTTAPSASMLAALQQGAGRVVLSSSTGKQRSYIQPDASLSLFTTHLLAAFQGAGNQPGSTEVRVTHLIQYVSRQVQDAAHALNARQTPFFQAASEDFVVSLIRGGAGLDKGGWEALQQDAHAAIAAASPPSPHPTITDSNVAIGNVIGGNLTQTTQSGDVNLGGAMIGPIGKIIHYHQNDRSPASLPDVLIDEYLKELIQECHRLPLAEVDDYQGYIDLGTVYTMLEVSSTVLSKTGDRKRQQTVLEFVNSHKQVVLLGDPGCGKSMFLKYLALTLAESIQDSTLDIRTNLEQWDHGLVIPIYVRLDEFAAWVGKEKKKHFHATNKLWDYLETIYPKDLYKVLHNRWKDGRTILLLDGYDEVPENPSFKEVYMALAFLRKINNSLIVITCRFLDYHESPVRRLKDWPDAKIIPFSESLREHFIHKWYTAHNDDNNLPKSSPENLCTEIQMHPELRRLAGNPLLLTMMVHLHASNIKLSSDRVKLYADCVEFLLYKWRPQYDDQELANLLELDLWGQEQSLDLLDRIGYAAHVLDSYSEDESGSDLPFIVLFETASGYFKTFDPKKKWIRAVEFATYLGIHGNLVRQINPDTFRFLHRTFQEFLAARCLIRNDDWSDENTEIVDRVLSLLPNPQWREVLTLSIKQLDPSIAIDIIDAILEHGQPRTVAKVVAAELLNEVGLRRLHKLGSRRQTLLSDTIDDLVFILKECDIQIESNYRIRAGFALGSLGDIRPGVCDLNLDWCVIHSSEWIESIEDNIHKIDQEITPFRMNRYLVTNAQWKLFRDDDGYTNDNYWVWPEGRDARNRGLARNRHTLQWYETKVPWTKPLYWDNPDFNLPNQPVVGISWYEADAFCRWLSDRLQYPIMLPTIKQWMLAAQGPHQRNYPWGDIWESDYANSGDNKVRKTTAVGSYPQGRSWCNVLDLTGNVCEWTISKDSHIDQSDMSHSRYILCGGSWFDEGSKIPCTVQFSHPAQRRTSLSGIRLITSKCIDS